MTLEERAQEIGCAWFYGGKAVAAEKLQALLEQARVEGARAMQKAAADKIDECCEPCLQCSINIENLNPEAIAKEVK